MISTTVKLILKARDRPTGRIIYWSTFTATASMMTMVAMWQSLLSREEKFARKHGYLFMILKRKPLGECIGQFQKGAVNVEHGHLGIKRPTEKTKDCIAWLEFFVNCVGQHQPDQKTIHLPSCFTILSIYKQMVQEHDSLGVTSVGLSQFYRIFNQNFPHVSLPKVTTVLYSVWLCIFTCIFFSPIKA